MISRYGKERAILVHPSDFHRLNDFDHLLAELSRTEPIALSPDALSAHRKEDTPGKPITDAAMLMEIFG